MGGAGRGGGLGGGEPALAGGPLAPLQALPGPAIPPSLLSLLGSLPLLYFGRPLL